MKNKSAIPEELNKIAYNISRKFDKEEMVFIKKSDMKEKPEHDGAFVYGVQLPSGMGMVMCNASRILWELWQAGVRNRDDLIVLATAVETKAMGKSSGHFIPELEPFFDASAEPVSRIYGKASEVFN